MQQILLHLQVKLQRSPYLIAFVVFSSDFLQFGNDYVNKLSSSRALTLVIAADGLRGVAANTLGMSDEFIQESCKSFCAVCSMEARGPAESAHARNQSVPAQTGSVRLRRRVPDTGYQSRRLLPQDLRHIPESVHDAHVPQRGLEPC